MDTLPPHSSLWLIVLCGVLGTCIGSFLNVVIYRLPLSLLQPSSQQLTLSFPASHCPACQTSLRWFDNIPILSWLSLRGRCRYCRRPIHWRYPLVESLCGTGFVMLTFGIPPTATAVWLLSYSYHATLLCLLLCISWIDAEHWLIPRSLSTYLGLLGLAGAWGGITPGVALPLALAGGLTGYSLAALLRMMFQRWRGHAGLGGGDVHLLGTLGCCVGLDQLGPLFLLAGLSASAYALLQRLKGQASSPPNAAIPAHALPFGPWLCLSALAILWLR